MFSIEKFSEKMDTEFILLNWIEFMFSVEKSKSNRLFAFFNMNTQEHQHICIGIGN